MKIAFVDNVPVGGGLSRFSLGLCKNLLKENQNIQITYFIHFDNIKRMPELYEIPNLEVKVLKSSIKSSKFTYYIKKLLKKIGIKFQQNKIKNEIEQRVNSYFDLAYFPTAHMMERPNLLIPVVGTFHDFNWKYFFGTTIFDKSFVDIMNIETINWLNNGENITLSNFTRNEAIKLFPNAKKFPTVIHIGSLSVYSEISEERSNEILDILEIDFPYILFPGNFFPHKNHLNLFTAFNLLKQKEGFQNYKLLLTGAGSNQISYGIAEYTGICITNKENYDVRGMGYQSNEFIDALISKAKLMVSPSIYEEMCQPAMDAWSFGTPTALSNIDPFKEHEEILGIKSAFFDPMDPYDISNQIELYLNDYDKAKSDALYSKQIMSINSWEIVTNKYMNVFLKAANK